MLPTNATLEEKEKTLRSKKWNLRGENRNPVKSAVDVVPLSSVATELAAFAIVACFVHCDCVFFAMK
jgi:hypothetical protein